MSGKSQENTDPRGYGQKDKKSQEKNLGSSVLEDITDRDRQKSKKGAAKSQLSSLESRQQPPSSNRQVSLESFDHKELCEGEILPWFLDTVGLPSSTTEEAEFVTEDARQILCLDCGSGDIVFQLHKFLSPNFGIVGIDSRLRHIKNARDKRTKILKQEGLYKIPEFPDDVEVENSISFFQVDIAASKLFEEDQGTSRIPQPQMPSTRGCSVADSLADANTAIIASLVKQKMPLQQFFSVVVRFLAYPPCFVLVTNLHEDVAPLVKGANNAYTMKEVIEMAKKNGLLLVREWVHRVDTSHIGKLGEGGKGWEQFIGTQCWFALAFKFDESKL